SSTPSGPRGCAWSAAISTLYHNAMRRGRTTRWLPGLGRLNRMQLRRTVSNDDEEVLPRRELRIKRAVAGINAQDRVRLELRGRRDDDDILRPHPSDDFGARLALSAAACASFVSHL